MEGISGLIHRLAAFFVGLGGFGLLLLGVLDSSFLFMPLGNDLLVIALTAEHPRRMLYYAAMAAAGSTIGVAFTDWVSRKTAEKGIEKATGKDRKKSRQVQYVEKKMKDRGGVALATAALMPPPFPFTPFIIVAAALQYPRRKLLLIVGSCRVLRFAIEGSLAIIFGRRIIELAGSVAFDNFMIGLIAVSVVGSAVSLMGWIRKSKNHKTA